VTDAPRFTRLRPILLYTTAWLPFAVLNAVGAIGIQHVKPWLAILTSVEATATIGLLGVPAWMLTGYAERRGTRAFAVVSYILVGIGYAFVCGAALQLLPFMSPKGNMGSLRFDTQHFVAPAFLYCVQLVAMLAVRNFARAERNRRAVIVAEQARAEAESMRARAELQALRAHLDPHFLFNTLNAIAAVVETDPPLARQMLVRAGALLRRVLDLGSANDDAIPLSDEMEIVSEYLAFERLRMGDRLRVETAIDDDALECAVPAFILQPLVENAIRHGIFPLTEGGTLRLSAGVTAGVLRIEVSDTGAGAAAGALDGAKGLGLRAARQRIAGAYGAAGRVDVTTTPGEGFRVCLTLPAREAAGV
jgi:signal transduction histidine kinase